MNRNIVKAFTDKTNTNQQPSIRRNKKLHHRAMYSKPPRTPSPSAQQSSSAALVHVQDTSAAAVNDQVLQRPPNTDGVAAWGLEVINDDAPFRSSRAAAAYASMDMATKRQNETTNLAADYTIPTEPSVPESLPVASINQEHPFDQSPEIHHNSTQSPVPPGCHPSPSDAREGEQFSIREAIEHSVSMNMPPHQNDEPSVLSSPMVEATCVEDSQEPVYDAYAVQDGHTSFWKRKLKYILSVLAALIFGAMAATVGALVVSQNKDSGAKEDTIQSIAGSDTPTTALYFADRKSKLCTDDPSGLPSINVRQRSFETIEECCRTEFWREANECMMSSLGFDHSVSPVVTTFTTTLATSSTAASTISSATTSRISSTAASYSASTAGWTITPTSSSSIPKSNVWMQQGHALVGDAAGDQAGRSVALSDDGMTLAIGATGGSINAGGRGYVKVYHKEKSWSSWVQLGQDLNAEADGDILGYSASLSANGRVVAIGAPGYWGAADRPGYVKVYYMEGSENSWKQLGQDIKGQADGDQFGLSVSLSSDGKTLAIGANANDDKFPEAGQVRVYQIDYIGTDSSWKQLGQDINGEAAYDASGFAVALSGDGNTLAIGADFNAGNGDKSGHVRVYEMRNDGNSPRWVQVGQDLDGESSQDYFGDSVALSSDGNILAIGAPAADDITTRTGYVKVYQRSGQGSSTSFQQLGQGLVGEAPDDKFGRSVALSQDGKILAVGANGNDGNGINAGHVRVYYTDSTDSQWKQLGQDISGANAGDEAGFKGLSLSGKGKTVAIGSNLNDDNGENAGHVRVFAIDV